MSLTGKQRAQVFDLFDAPWTHYVGRHIRIDSRSPAAEAEGHARHAAPDLAGALTMPSVRPARSSPSHCGVGHAQPFASISRPIGISFLASAIISAKAPSATVASAYSGTFTTGMPRAIAAGISIASMPTPYLTMPLSFPPPRLPGR